MMWLRFPRALGLCACLWSCGSDGGLAATPAGQGQAPPPPATTMMDAAVQPPPASTAGQSGASQPSAAGTVAAADGGGGSGAGGSGGGAGSNLDAGVAHVCSIPNELMILPSDADGGVDPSCQNVPLKVIAENCIGGFCHDSNGPPAGGLDLMAPCVAERLINVKSKCQDLLLLDTAHPEQSLLLDKINSKKAKCGETMPFAGHLPQDELICMNAWISAVLRAATK